MAEPWRARLNARGAPLASSALVLIDVQDDFLDGSASPVPGIHAVRRPRIEEGEDNVASGAARIGV